MPGRGGGGGFKVDPAELRRAASTLERQGAELAAAHRGLIGEISATTGDAQLDMVIAGKVAEAGRCLADAGEVLYMDAARFSTTAESYSQGVDRNLDVIRQTLQAALREL